MKKGFYNKEKFVKTCEDCKQYENCKHPKQSYKGKGKKGILIIGEYPTKLEDDLNEFMTGSSFDYLRDALDVVGLDLAEDCWFTYAIKCKAGFKPSADAYTVCRQFLYEEINNLQPTRIITLGQHALKTLIGHRTTGRANFTPFEKWIGWEIPDQELGAFVYPLDHPKTILQNYYHPLYERRFVEGLERVTKDRSFYLHNYESEYLITTEEKEAIQWLGMLNTKDTLVFDYETTGIKPHREGHRILCVSFSDGLFSWAFPIFDSVEFHKALRKVLRNKKLKKVSFNMGFEETWTRQILGYKVANWHFDSMIAAHVLDNRSSISNLKFQTYVNLGVLGYDDGVDTYMTKCKEGEDKKSGNRFNCLDECPIEDLLTYCALDSLFTYKIYEKQYSTLYQDKHLWKGYKLLHETALSFTDMEWSGVKLNIDVLEKNINTLDARMHELHEDILSCKSINLWDGEKEFNYNSSKQLSHLLYDILKYPVKKETKSGAPATDVEALQDIKEPFVEKMLERKKLDKLKTTYLLGMKRECVGGIIHPSFSIHTTQSYRASSSNPNFQNLAAHDIFAREMVLGCIIPKNDRIVAVDEKSLEVMIGACYHLDKQMLAFLADENMDMHRTVSARVFLCSEKEVSKEMRQVGKTINFASAYGSSAFNLAHTSWFKLFTPDMRKHMKNHGIRTFQQYLIHIESIMEWYWEELFMDYGKWRNKNWEDYLDRGYIDLKTGLRCTDIMRFTQAGNFPVQGSAANLVCFSINRINEYIRENNLKSRIIMYIHDSIEFDIVDEEWENGLKDQVHYWMTKGLSDNFDWVIAPLGIEMEYHSKDFNVVDSSEKLGMFAN